MSVLLKQNIFPTLFLTFLVGMTLSCHKTEVSAPNTGNLKFYGGPLDDFPTETIPTSDGGFAITGYTNRNLNNDMFLLKLDHDGNQQWYKTYGGPKDDAGNALVQTSDGGYLITGSTNSFGKAKRNNTSYLDVYAVRTDQNGDTIWTRTYGYKSPGFNSHFNDYANTVCNAADGSHYIGGLTYNYVVNHFAYPASLVMKIKDNGDTIWTKGFDPSYIAFVNTRGLAALMEDKDQNLVTCGYTDSVNFKKISPNGNIVWSNKNAVASTGAGLPYVIGYANNLIQKSDGSYNVICTVTDNYVALSIISGINISNNGKWVTVQNLDSIVEPSVASCGFQGAINDADYIFAVSNSTYNNVGPGGFNIYYLWQSPKTLLLLKTLGGWPVSIIQGNGGKFFITGYANKSGTSHTTIFTESVVYLKAD